MEKLKIINIFFLMFTYFPYCQLETSCKCSSIPKSFWVWNQGPQLSFLVGIQPEFF